MGIIRYISLTTLASCLLALVIYHAKVRSYIENQIPDLTTKPLVAKTELLPTAPKENQKLTPTELRNNKIDQVLSLQSTDFYRCQQNRVSEIGEIRGLALMGVTILPSGRVADVSLLKSNINDKPLIQCLVRSIYRAKFPPFKGAALKKAYPIEFQ